MRKFIPIFVLLMAFVLAGCLPKDLGTATVLPSPTASNKPAPTLMLTVPVNTLLQPSSGCTVVAKKPTAGPTAVSIFPPVSASDWVKGPADAKVTIIEYSDFQ